VHDERWWLEHQKVIARAMIDALSEYTTNITWDTVIGYAISSPYTITRLKNMAPTGNWYVIDHVPAQDLSMRPIPELAGHKVPGLKNFYCTGSAWPGSVGANAAPAYNCYKVIAEDYGLPEPPGKARGRPY
jgi:phytoene dehydrogenase-like protein